MTKHTPSPSSHPGEKSRFGIRLLMFFNLLAGLGSIYFLLDLFLTHHPDNVIVGLFGVVYTGSMGLSGLCIMIRKPWSWPLAATAQVIAAGCPTIPALYGIYGAVTSTGDFAHAAAFGGFLIFFGAIILAMIPLPGVFHLLKPGVRGLFQVRPTVDH
ncbi:MAG: hypothetical protein JNL58_00675 [Planctomyces sp.]|nr:hypothetical protein [Planctomyces sp.]